MMEQAVNKIKILIVVRELGTGGAEKVLINLANNFDHERFSLSIAFVEDGSYRTFVDGRVELVQFRARTVLGVAYEIRKLVITRGYDVVFFSWIKPLVVIQLLNLFKSLRVRTIFRVPISLKSQIRYAPFYNNVLLRRLLSKALSKTDRLIALCDSMKEELVRDFKIDERKITVIHNPVNVELVVKKATEFNPFEGEEGKVQIVSAGRLEYQKGFDVLLKAFKMVVIRQPNAVLTIVGKGSKYGRLRKLVRKLELDGKVRFIGWAENPYAYFKHADVFVLSSRFEGFPNVLLEALACGTKVVATDCATGPREILGENEEYGWLAKMEDPVSLAEKLLEAIRSPKKPALETLRRFSLETAVKAYEDLISGVVKPRLMVLLSELGHGGAQRVALVLAKYLAKDEVTVTVAALKDGDYREYIEDSDAELILLNTRRARNVVHKLAYLIRRLRPDVIFTTLFQDYCAAVLAKALVGEKPKIIMRLSNDPNVILKGPLRKFFGRMLIKRADKIVAQTERMRSNLITSFGIDEKRVVTIVNPVDVDFIKAQSLEFEPFGNFPGTLKIVSAGRLVYQKGFDVLLKAFREVFGRFPNARLFILGDGDERGYLEALAGDLGIAGAVEFVGWTPNPYPYFRGCDLFVLSSRYEGMPNVLLEALACGAKVVATDCPTGPREILSSNGECGWLVPVDNHEELAAAMVKALQTGPRSSERCLERFAAHSVVQAYRELIRVLTGW